MAARDNNDSTNLPLIKVGRSGKVKVANADKKDEDAAAFKRLMAKMQEEAGPGGYLHGRGALDHDDLLYLKEQHQAEQDAERMRDQSEKRAFAAFKAAATTADASQPSLARIEPKARSGIKQQSLLKNLVEVKPKRPRILANASSGKSSEAPGVSLARAHSDVSGGSWVHCESPAFPRQTSGSVLLGLSYDGSDDEDSDASGSEQEKTGLNESDSGLKSCLELHPGGANKSHVSEISRAVALKEGEASQGNVGDGTSTEKGVG